MIRRAHGPLLARHAAGLLAVASLSACATTFDTSATTVPATTTTVYRPTGTTDELLADISLEASSLSEKVVDNDGQRVALERIEAQWAVARPAIAEQRPELIDAFDAAIAQVQRSVERRRPADADKAAKNLTTLITAYQA